MSIFERDRAEYEIKVSRIIEGDVSILRQRICKCTTDSCTINYFSIIFQKVIRLISVALPSVVLLLYKKDNLLSYNDHLFLEAVINLLLVCLNNILMMFYKLY